MREGEARQPPPFPSPGDGAFDAIVSGFTLHYIQDWSIPLREMTRVLRPGGALVFSTHHPANDLAGAEGYFRTAPAHDTWLSSNGQPVAVSFYHRPLEAIFEALFAAGFVVERLLERGPEWGEAGQPWFVCLRCRPAV